MFFFHLRNFNYFNRFSQCGRKEYLLKLNAIKYYYNVFKSLDVGKQGCKTYNMDENFMLLNMVRIANVKIIWQLKYLVGEEFSIQKEANIL